MRRKGTTVIDRFWSKVTIGDLNDCWEWQGAKIHNGYGSMGRPGGGQIRAHRFSALLHFGPFDRRLWVLHHCDNRACVNPRHLYLGDVVDNSRDVVVRKRARMARVTHCHRGHELTLEGIFPHSKGWRVCRKCSSIRGAAYRARKKAAAGGVPALGVTG